MSRRTTPLSRNRRDEYTPYPLTCDHFHALDLRGVELYRGGLYQIKTSPIIEAAKLRILTSLAGVLGREPWVVCEPPAAIEIDPHNALRPDIVVSKGMPIACRNASIVVEFDREEGFGRSREGRMHYLDAGVYAHWLVDANYHWIEITCRLGSKVYNGYDDVVPLVVDDLIMGEFRLSDLV